MKNNDDFFSGIILNVDKNEIFKCVIKIMLYIFAQKYISHTYIEVISRKVFKL